MFDDFDTELQVEDRFDDIAEQENAEDWAAEMAMEDAREEFARFEDSDYEPSDESVNDWYDGE